jgi:hypothetical protein
MRSTGRSAAGSGDLRNCLRHRSRRRRGPRLMRVVRAGRRGPCGSWLPLSSTAGSSRGRWVAARSAAGLRSGHWRHSASRLPRVTMGSCAGRSCLRDGERVYETYWTTGRATEVMAPSYGLLDMTVYGRQETWEDSPDGWPRPFATTGEQFRRDGRPHRPMGPGGSRTLRRPRHRRCPGVASRGPVIPERLERAVVGDIHDVDRGQVKFRARRALAVMVGSHSAVEELRRGLPGCSGSGRPGG